MKDKFNNVNPDDSAYLEAKMLHEVNHLLVALFHVFVDWLNSTKFYTCDTPM